MTIDEVARASGLTSRNVRAYQSRGLLPPPTVEGRVGHYDEGHLARLRLITRLQRQGFSLAAVAELLRAWEEGQGLADVLGFEEALTTPFIEREEPGFLTLSELAERFPGGTGDDLARAVELQILEPEGDGYRVVSPRLLEIGTRLVAAGLPVSVAIEAAARLRERIDAIAADFVELFETHVWEPFATAGMPPDRLAGVTSSLQRMRPLGFEAVAHALAEALERKVMESTARQAVASRPGAPGAPAGDAPEPAPD